MTVPPECAAAEALKDRLRACKTTEEVNATVKEIAPEVEALAAADPVGVIHIKNLAAWKRNCLKEAPE